MSKVAEVYEALETGQYKYALQVCNKSLKKAKAPNDVAQLMTYKALAILFIGNGKDEEAAALVDQVRKRHPVDRRVIASLSQALDILGKGSESSLLYESASKKMPKDEDFARFWFQQMILRCDIDGARKAAMVLNKLPNQRKYFYWLLTTWKNHNPNKQVRPLSLSMMAKLIDHALSTPYLLPERIGEALLLVSVAPPEQALRFLRGDGKKWTTDIEIRRSYIDLLRDSGNYIDLRNFCEDEVDQGVDDWKIVKGWVDGYIGLCRSNKEQVDAIKALQSKLDSKYALRNFALGTIYLSASCSPDLTFDGLPSPREQCVRYFAQYGRKAACFQDIRSYVAELPRDEQIRFLQDIAGIHKDAKPQKPVDGIYREINILKFDYMLRPWTVDDPNDLVRCWELYLKGTKVLGATEDMDNLPGDDALLLGCYTLVKAYAASKKTGYLIQACVCLETGLEKSKHNFQFKLLLIRIYLLLGATQKAIKLYATLSIKQVQHDTLSHIVLSRISTLTTNNEVLQQIAMARTIYAANEDETPPQIYQAFIEETYHNIPDFWDLWMRLRHSLTRNALWRDREIIGWLNNQNMESVEEINEELYDQRDVTVFMDCELPGNPSPEEFTRIWPLQKDLASKVLTYGQRMICALENLVSKGGTLDNLECFRLLRSSDEIWNAFRLETTAAEFAMMELFWENYESHVDVLNGTTDKLLELSETLKNKIPLNGLDTKDVSWEAVHATVTTLQICRCLFIPFGTAQSQAKKAVGKARATIMEAVINSLTICVQKIEIKMDTYSPKKIDEFLNELKGSLLDDEAYMLPMKELINDESAVAKLRDIIGSQYQIYNNELQAVKALMEQTIKLKSKTAR